MKFLLDTNIYVPLEPTSPGNLEPNSALAADLVRLSNRAGATLFLQDAQFQDIGNDPEPGRRALREVLAGKYSRLKEGGKLPSAFVEAVGLAAPGTNDYVDNQLLASLYSDAIDYLISEDLGVHRKAARLTLGSRVLNLREAVQLLQDLFDEPTPPPPAVEFLESYRIDASDPIWESFRLDYPGFDDWLRKAKLDHRPSWIIPGKRGYAGVAIAKTEDPAEYGLNGKQLKICSFKVDPLEGGLRYGELLLKAVFGYVHGNKHEWIVVTVFEHHVQLLELLTDFGFEVLKTKTPLGELVLAKPMRQGASGEILSGAEFNRRFGPYSIDWSQEAFAVPIWPLYHDLLFPELRSQPPLLSGTHPFGNSIRKAYLSRSNSVRIRAGSIVAFYRSQDLHAMTVLGVVESVLRSSSAEAIAATVGNRTVYSYQEIQAFTERPTLAILFRQASQFDPPIRLHVLEAAGVLRAAPQSITQLDEVAKQWLKHQLNASP